MLLTFSFVEGSTSWYSGSAGCHFTWSGTLEQRYCDALHPDTFHIYTDPRLHTLTLSQKSCHICLMLRVAPFGCVILNGILRPAETSAAASVAASGSLLAAQSSSYCVSHQRQIPMRASVGHHSHSTHLLVIIDQVVFFINLP